MHLQFAMNKFVCINNTRNTLIQLSGNQFSTMVKNCYFIFEKKGIIAVNDAHDK